VASIAKRRRLAPLLLVPGLAILPARSENPVVALGKQRAAVSPLEWSVGDTAHPILGSIRFAVLKDPVATPVGNARVTSRAYVSCERSTRRIAIELAHGTGPDDPGGLKPKSMPRLVCNRLAEGDKLVQEALEAHWDVNELGDALARGFAPFPLRECVTIDVTQEVALPGGWSRPSARVAFAIAPYSKELDSVFVACGENSAYTPAELFGAPPATLAVQPAPPTAPLTRAPEQAAAPTPAPLPVAKPPPPAPAPAAVVAKPQPPAPAPAVVAKPTPPPPAAALVARPTPPPPAPAVVAKPPPPAPARVAEAPWISARVPASGKTNMRAGPSLTAAIVVVLDPGAVVLVQNTGNEWWRARSPAGREGYIREDRLVLR
jgi:hypothetical protein